MQLVHDVLQGRRSARADAASRPSRVDRATVRAILGRLTLAFAVSLATNACASRILVVKSAETTRLATTLAALRERSGMPVDVVSLDDVTKRTWDAVLATGERPGVVVALGPRASEYVVRQPVPLPTVHCLAGHDAMRAGLPALPSEVPTDLQALWLRRLVPDAKTIGLAFEPNVNTRRAEATAAALGAAGYRTWMTPVESPSALPAALEQLAKRADVLFALPDPIVYTRESARGVLLHTFRRRIPLIGANEYWVQAGALYAVDWDYGEVGALCAQLASREMRGAKSAPPPAPPRPRVWVNLRAAKHFGLRWDDALLRSVDHRHE